MENAQQVGELGPGAKLSAVHLFEFADILANNPLLLPHILFQLLLRPMCWRVQTSIISWCCIEESSASEAITDHEKQAYDCNADILHFERPGFVHDFSLVTKSSHCYKITAFLQGGKTPAEPLTPLTAVGDRRERKHAASVDSNLCAALSLSTTSPGRVAGRISPDVEKAAERVGTRPRRSVNPCPPLAKRSDRWIIPILRAESTEKTRLAGSQPLRLRSSLVAKRRRCERTSGSSRSRTRNSATPSSFSGTRW